MKIGNTILHALLAAVEANLLILPVGILFFYPIMVQYEFTTWWETPLYSAGCMLVFGLAVSLFFLTPVTTVIETLKKDVSRPELVGKLGALGLGMLLTATLAYKAYQSAELAKPGEQGKLWLFGMLMAIMLVTWTFTIRYKYRSRRKA